MNRVLIAVFFSTVIVFGTSSESFAQVPADSERITSELRNFQEDIRRERERLSLKQVKQEKSNESGRINHDLLKIKDKIEREQRWLIALRKEQAQIEIAVSKNADQIQAVRNRRNSLLEKIEELNRKLKITEGAIEKSSNAIEVYRQAHYKRIIAVYKLYRRTTALEYLFHAGSVTDLLKRTFYLTVVARNDRTRLDKLNSLLNSFAEDQKTLQRIQEETAMGLDEVASIETDLSAKELKTASLLRESKAKTEQTSQSLDRLRYSLKRLDTTLGRIMGSEQTEEVPKEIESATLEVEQLKSESSPVPEFNTKTQQVKVEDNFSVSSEEQPEADFEGGGLDKLKGQLPLPVVGKLIQGFGKRQLRDFEDEIFVKGMEFEVLGEAQIKAVAPGKVVFSQSLPGYGKVVIIDHGTRHYTLYGRLGEVLCKPGQTLQAGQNLALSGEPQERGNFYFELRIRGKAVDPMGYFRQKPV